MARSFKVIVPFAPSGSAYGLGHAGAKSLSNPQGPPTGQGLAVSQGHDWVKGEPKGSGKKGPQVRSLYPTPPHAPGSEIQCPGRDPRGPDLPWAGPDLEARQKICLPKCTPDSARREFALYMSGSEPPPRFVRCCPGFRV